MAITRNFRPAQHTYQSTYEPFPFKEIAPIAMKMQQEYTQGMQAASKLDNDFEQIVSASPERDK